MKQMDNKKDDFVLGYEIEEFYINDFFGKPFNYISKWYFNEIIEYKDLVNILIENKKFYELEKINYYINSLENNFIDEKDEDQISGFLYLIKLFEELVKKRMIYYFLMRKKIKNKNNKKNDVINYKISYEDYYSFNEIFINHHFITPTEYDDFVKKSFEGKNVIDRTFYDDSLYVKLEEDVNLSDIDIYGILLNSFDKQFSYRLNKEIIPILNNYDLNNFENFKTVFGLYYVVEVDENENKNPLKGDF